MGKYPLGTPPEVIAWFESPLYKRTQHHEIFTHVDHLLNKVRHIDATDLYAACVAGKVDYYFETYHFRPIDVRHIYKNQGIEGWRVERLTYQVCRRPILVCLIPQNDLMCTVVIDGN